MHLRTITFLCLCITLLTGCNEILENEFSIINGSRSVTEDFKDVYVTGFTSSINQQNTKLLFNKELASLTGLEARNVYITRYEKYRYVVKIDNGWTFFEEELYDKCGLRTSQSFEGSQILCANRGYNIISTTANQVVIETNLIHVVSDMAGHALNIYYPCKPAEIEWHYYLFKE